MKTYPKRVFFVFLSILCILFFSSFFLTAQNNDATNKQPSAPDNNNDDDVLLISRIKEYGCQGFTALDISPDNSKIVAGCQNGCINLYSLPDLKKITCLKETAHPGLDNRKITSIAFSPDGKTIAAAYGMAVHLFQTDSSNQKAETVRGVHNHAVTTLLFSEDGNNIYSGDKGGLIQISSVENKQYSDFIRAHGRRVSALDLSDNGSRLISASYDRTIKIWDLAEGTLVRTIRGHRAPVKALVIAENGTIITGGADNQLILWQPITGAPITKREFRNAEVTSLALNEKIDMLAVGIRPALSASSSSKTILLLNPRSLATTDGYPPLPGLPSCFAFTDDGARLALGTGPGPGADQLLFLKVPGARQNSRQ